MIDILECGVDLADALTQRGIKPGVNVAILVGGRTIQDIEEARGITMRDGDVATAIIAPEGIEVLVILSTIASAIASAVPGASLVGGVLASGIGYGLGGGAAAMFFGEFVGYLAGTLLVTAGFGALASLAGGALGDQPSKRNSAGGGSQSPRITGLRNEPRLFAPIPQIFGIDVPTTPPYGTRASSENVGDDRYLRILFVVGEGPLTLSDFKFGDRSISEFDDVQLEWSDGAGNFHRYLPGPPGSIPDLTLFSDTILEESLNIEITHPNMGRGTSIPFSAGPSFSRTSETDANELMIELDFPAGIGAFAPGDSKASAEAIGLYVEIRELPGGEWQSAIPFMHDLPGFVSKLPSGNKGIFGSSPFGIDLLVINGFERKGFARGIRIHPPNAPGQYDIRITRYIGHRVGQKLETIIWSALRSIRKTNPITVPGLAIIEIRAKESDQLSGIIDKFNCKASSHLPYVDSGLNLVPASVSNPPSNNPADVFLKKLLDRPDALDFGTQVDAERIREWRDECESTGRTFQAELTQEITKIDFLRDVTAASRARTIIRGGKWSVAVDRARDPATEVAQHFTPRNSISFRGVRTFPDLPHMIRVRFQNELNGFLEDELRVYESGFDDSSSDRIEVLEPYGVTHPEKAWREGRFKLKDVKIRGRESFELDVSWEWVALEQGDLVLVTYDVPKIGSVSARIAAVETNGSGHVVAATLDEDVTFLPGISHVLRSRLVSSGGETISRLDGLSNPSTTNPVTTRSVTFASPLSAGTLPEPGALCVFGVVSEESAEFTVLGVRPGENMVATLILAPHGRAEGLFDESEEFPGHITAAHRANEDRPPPPPFFRSIQDQPAAQAIVVGFGIENQQEHQTSPARVQAQYRVASPQGDWIAGPFVDLPASSVTLAPLPSGFRFDIRIRTVSRYGVTSAWIQSASALRSDVPLVAGLFSVTGLALTGGTFSQSIPGGGAEVEWKLASPDYGAQDLNDPVLLDLLDRTIGTPTYQVEVYAEDRRLLRRATVTDRRYQYTIEQILADGGPISFTFEVRFVDVLGQVSAPAILEVFADKIGLPFQIGEVDIFDGAISSAKIRNLAVQRAKITDLAVSTIKIEDQSITEFSTGQLLEFTVARGNSPKTVELLDHFFTVSPLTSLVQIHWEIKIDHASNTAGKLIDHDLEYLQLFIDGGNEQQEQIAAQNVTGMLPGGRVVRTDVVSLSSGGHTATLKLKLKGDTTPHMTLWFDYVRVIVTQFKK